MATILIVDDHPANREFLVNLLGYQGHRLLEAGDGREGLLIATDLRPDLIIADILMPTMDGYEFVRQLRSDPDLPKVPVIFWTSDYRERESQNLARACGVTHILLKPSEPEQVLAIVNEVLGLAMPETPPPSRKEFDREHLRLLTDKLSQKADGLNAANRRLAALIDVNLQLVSETDVRRLLKIVCRAARSLVGAKCAVVAINKSIGAAPEFFITGGLKEEAAVAAGAKLPGSLVVRNLLQTRRASRLTSLSGDPKSMGFPVEYPPLHSFLGVPILSASGSCGWLCLTNKLGADAFDEEDERIVSILAAQVGRIYENRSLYAEVQHKARQLENEVSERKQAETEVRELNSNLEQRVQQRTAELEHANRELEAFSYSVSHDLRAPLRYIHGYVDLLKLGLEGQLAEKTAHYLAEICSSADQMSQLVEDLLGFSRAGRTELRQEPVDLNLVAEEARQKLGPDVQERNILWKIGPLPHVLGDTAMLNQVFVNLLSNAIKYTRLRDPAEIEIGCFHPPGEESVVFVRDNGVGFDMEYADKLFGVFQRLHTADEFEGNGIGLANVRRIISRHGGRTWADGKKNGGASFFFSFPADHNVEA